MTKEEALEIVLDLPVIGPCQRCLSAYGQCDHCYNVRLVVCDEWVEANLLLRTMSVKEAHEVFENGPNWMLMNYNGEYKAVMHYTYSLCRAVLNSSQNVQS